MTTKIEWAEETWNPTTGCTKVSPGCAHCYIERTPPMRMAGRKFSKGAIPIELHPERIDKPLHWRQPRRVFVNSMSDLFHEDIPDSFITAVFGVMAAAPQHTFLVLTKRAERMRAWAQRITAAGGLGTYIRSDAGRIALRSHFDSVIQTIERYGELVRDLKDPWMQVMNGAGCNMGNAPLPNVWLGVSVENQEQTQRIEHLLATPAAVRFLSVEPMLGPVDLNRDGGWLVPWDESDGACGPDQWNKMFICDKGHAAKMYLKSEGLGYNACLAADCRAPVRPAKPGIDWVICGGESGPGAREFVLEYAVDLLDQCRKNGVAFFMKQLGSFPVTSNFNLWDFDDSASVHVDDWGHFAAGVRFHFVDKKGGDMAEWPEQLRVREFPQAVGVVQRRGAESAEGKV
jgi:protein gp37